MSAYDEINEQDNQRTTKLPTQQVPRLSKHGQVKQAFDFLATTPGKMRRGRCTHGDSLTGFTDYNIKLFRGDDGKWALYVEWVDPDGEGHRLILPHEVVAGVLQRAASIRAQCRSERARNAAMTRKHKKQQSEREQG